METFWEVIKFIGLGTIIAVTGLIVKSIRRVNQVLAEEAHRIEAFLDRIEKASGTITARTDLGIYLLNSTGSMSDDLNSLRSSSMFLIVVASAIMVILRGNMVTWKSEPELWSLFTVLLFAYGGICIWLLFRERKVKGKLRTFQRRFENIWIAVIDEHISRAMRREEKREATDQTVP